MKHQENTMKQNKTQGEFKMKKILIVIAIAVVGFTTVANAADVVASRVIDSALAYQKAGGKAEFMGGEKLVVTD